MTTADGNSCSRCTNDSALSDSLDVGALVPDLTLSDAAGSTTGLSTLRGAPAIITFLGDDWDPVRAEYLARYDEMLREVATVDIEDSSGVARVHFEGSCCRIGFADRSELRSAIVRECDLPADAARRFGVHGKKAVFVVDGDGIIRWRLVVAGGYPQPSAIREALRAALGPATATNSLMMRGGMSRRDFVGTAIAAALAVALLSTGEHRAFARDADQNSPATASPGQAAGVPVTLQVNGVTQTLNLDPRVTVLDALREYMGLYGSKKGCDHGQCGACTVHIDGRRVNSCLTLAIAAQGKAITTIEGLAQGETLHPMQQAFLKHDGFQCGYCTPGQIMSAVALIKEGYAKSRDDVRELMSGNLCRCGAYPNIVDAVEEVRTGGVKTARAESEGSDADHVSV